MHIKKLHACMIFLTCQYSNEHRAQHIIKGLNMTKNAKNFNFENFICVL